MPPSSAAPCPSTPPDPTRGRRATSDRRFGSAVRSDDPASRPPCRRIPLLRHQRQTFRHSSTGTEMALPNPIGGPATQEAASSEASFAPARASTPVVPSRDEASSRAPGAGRVSASALRRVASRISALACATERAFLRAGSSLEQAIDRFDRLSAPLSELSALAEAGEFAAAAAEAAELEGKATAFAAKGHPLFDRIMALAASSDTLQADLGAMRQVIRTMSIVALNARVTVASLTEQNAGLDVFTSAATSQVMEASNIIGQITDAVEGMGRGLQVAAVEAEALSHLLSRHLGPALSGLRLDMAAFEVELTRATAEGSALVRHGQDFRQAITTAVLSLQIGDTTRQRLEHVAAFLCVANTPDADDAMIAHLALALAAGQLRDAHERHAAAIFTARSALRDSGQETAEIGRISARIASAPRHNLKHHLQRLQDILSECRRAQARLVVVAEGLSEGLANLLQVLDRMSGVEERMGMIGLNAVIACVQLGDEALALREISMQLRELAATSAERLRQITVALSTMGEEAGATARELSGAFRTDLDELTLAGERVFQVLSRIETSVLTVGTTVERERRMAERDVAAGIAALDSHSAAFVDLLSIAPALDRWSGRLGSGEAGPGAAQVMAAIRSQYTMAAERLVHDAIMRDICPEAATEESGDTTAQTAEDICDFLF
ncbi:chemotaxis protein [Cereibacter sphaeroides]|uniref:chemotaxis protein n=2 Tax=Cereibacter sphaeroides TaxID=1063 RepID=UPI001F26FC35|nr:chemotaxis protein [Cereibacter sphaeroides]MCE6967823.1 chemotaxis protein [Cereibacter sphaeroides]